MDINQNLDEIAMSATKDLPTEEATSNFIGDFTTTEEEVHFVTGSSYKGSWDALGMTGVGRYVMPNGTVYDGEMRDGMFHGHGSLYWSKNQRLDVVHLQGKLQEYKYTFADGLSYRDKDWSYCKFPDRRFYESKKKGLRPGGRSRRSAKQPTQILPAGCYDAGDGIFDPKTLCVTSYDDSNKILRTPTQEECNWIVEKCRKSWTEPTGYRTSLNENWSDDPPELLYSLAMSEDSPDPWWKRLTKFERDLRANIDDESDEPNDDEYLEMPELCLCGQYVILGEPCYCIPHPVTSKIEWQDDSVEKRFYGEQSSQYDENEEVEDKDLYPATSTDSSSEYVIGERIIEGIEAFAFNVPEIDISEKISQNVSYENFFDTYRISGENLEDEVDDEQLLLIAANSRPETENEETKDNGNLQKDAEEKLGNQEDEREAESEDHEEKENSEVAIEKSSLRDSSDKSHEYHDEGPENMEENTANAKDGVSTIPSETSLENHDYVTAATITREKVSGAAEPETANDRRTETKFLPEITKTGSIEDVDKDDDRNVAELSGKIKSPSKTEIFAEELVETLEGIENEVAKKQSIEKYVASFEKDESSEKASESQFAEENKEIVEGEPKTSVETKSNQSLKASEISEQTSQDLAMKRTKDLRTQMANGSRNKLGDEISGETELISDSQISSHQVLMGIKGTSSSADVQTEEKSLSALKTEEISLENVHPSLASLVAKEQKPSKHEEIIEIYKNVSKKEKSKKKCSDANVWRLSSTLRNYKEGTKMPCYSCGLRQITNAEDLHSVAALKTSTSRPVEYGRKPCDSHIRKATTQEVPVIALPCREEYPFKIQTKPDRSTDKQGGSKIRKKK